MAKSHLKTTLKCGQIQYFSSYHTLVIIQTLLKKRFKILLKLFAKIYILKLYLLHSRSVTSFHIKIHYHFIFNNSLFICENCKVCYKGEATRHSITRTNEHLQKDPESNIFKHLQESRVCNSVCNWRWRRQCILNRCYQNYISKSSIIPCH